MSLVVLPLPLILASIWISQNSVAMHLAFMHFAIVVPTFRIGEFLVKLCLLLILDHNALLELICQLSALFRLCSQLLAL